MTTPAPSSQAKVCVRCGKDCSNKPRTKDARGRYTCRACFDAAQGEQAITLEPARPKRTEPRIEPVGDGVGVYEMMLDDAVKEAAAVTTAPCPGCGRALRSDAALCVNCGHNTRTGAAVTTKKVKGEVPMNARARALDRERELAAQARRMEYIKPVLMVLIGGGILCGIWGSQAGAGVVPVYAIWLTINVAVTMVIFFLCCVLWIGFDAPFHLTAMRLAGIYAVSECAQVVVGSVIPFGWIPWIVGLFFFIGLLQSMLDLEMQDAVILAFLTMIAKFVGMIVIFAALMSAFGV